MKKKLTSGEKHLLGLIRTSLNDPEGWCPVSARVMPLLRTLPKELVEFPVVADGGNRVRLTPLGNNILDAMEWL